MARLDEHHVSCLFTRNGCDVYRMIAYCEQPTATFENVETKERVHVGACSAAACEFILLCPEKEVDSA